MPSGGAGPTTNAAHSLLLPPPLQRASARLPCPPAPRCPALPCPLLPHRATEELFVYLGASIGYWRGDIKGLMDDICESAAACWLVGCSMIRLSTELRC